AILLMSVVYMGLALTVYSVHRNWRDHVERPQATGTKALGLRFQLEQLQEEKALVETEYLAKERELKTELAQKTQRLATLEAERQALLNEHSAMVQQLSDAQKTNGALSASVEGAQRNLTILTG